VIATCLPPGARLGLTEPGHVSHVNDVPLPIQALVLSHAGHRLSLWSAELPAAISWLGKNIPAFAYR